MHAVLKYNYVVCLSKFSFFVTVIYVPIYIVRNITIIEATEYKPNYKIIDMLFELVSHGEFSIFVTVIYWYHGI